MKNEDISYFLRVMTDDVSMSVIKMIQVDNAVTRDEICKALSIEKDTVDAILLSLMERNIICCGIDDRGKKGYLQAANMVGVWMILAGCRIAGCGGEGVGNFWMSRK